MERRNEYFNPAPPTILHIDLNSCFATIEQQAKPLLRGKPIGIAPFVSNGGCVIAPSIEAKAKGVKTGMRVWEAKKICPSIQILPPDPYKYRFVHMRMRQVLNDYTPKVRPKSIDEFVLDMSGTPAFKQGMLAVGREIKDRIMAEIGGHLTVSVGVANNQCLAKLAAGLHKPDGLDVIDISNYWDIYKSLKLKDLPGIDVGYSRRLSLVGVHSITDMYNQHLGGLKAGFQSVVGEDWYARLRGWEADNVEYGTKSFSNQRVIHPSIISANDILKVVMFLIWKTTSRMRIAGYQARYVDLGFNLRTGYYWGSYRRLPHHTFSSSDIFAATKEIFYSDFPREYITQVFVGVRDLMSLSDIQLSLLNDVKRQSSLYAAIDKIEHRYGKNTIKPALMIGTEGIASHRIPFNSTKEMEQYLFNGDNLFTD